MSIDNLSTKQVTPVARLKHSSAIFNSTGRVRAAFKSPLKVAKEVSESKQETSDHTGKVAQNPNLTEICAEVKKLVKRKRIFSGQFKTPTKSKKTESATSIDTGANIEDQQKKLQNLETYSATLEKDISDLRLQGHREEDLQKYINILHEYNEIKDAAQLVLGELAKHLHVTTSSLYRQFGLNIDD